MKISLIFPNRNIGRRKKLDAITPPLGLAYLAAVLEKGGFETTVIDAFVENLSFNKLNKSILQINPNIIGITTNVDIIFHSLLTAKVLKKQLPNVKIVLGGPYATDTYNLLLKKYEFIDYIILGEGEYSFIESIKRIEKNESLENVKGIAFLKNNHVIETPPNPPIEDLDKLPFPAWHLFPNLKKYKYFTKTSRAVPILTSRGCPYKCIFCTKCVFGHKIRFRSPKNVYKEMEYCVNRYNITEFGVADDHFSFNPERAKKICDLIIKSGLKIHFSLANGIRADTISAELVKKLRMAGCWFIAIGIESGNEQVLHKIGKNVKLTQIQQSIEICKQNKMLVAGYFVIGLPYDNKNTINDTINFARESNLDLAIFNMAIPIPGTKLFEIVEKNGKFLFPSKQKYLVGMNTQYEGPYFEIWDLKAGDVKEGHKRAYREFYFHPLKLISLVTKIYSRRQLMYILNYFKNMFLI